jgi:hypothetical protein
LYLYHIDVQVIISINTNYEDQVPWDINVFCSTNSFSPSLLIEISLYIYIYIYIPNSRYNKIFCMFQLLFYLNPITIFMFQIFQSRTVPYIMCIMTIYVTPHFSGNVEIQLSRPKKHSRPFKETHAQGGGNRERVH